MESLVIVESLVIMDDLVVVRLVALVRLVVVRAWLNIYVEIKIVKARLLPRED